MDANAPAPPPIPERDVAPEHDVVSEAVVVSEVVVVTPLRLEDAVTRAHLRDDLDAYNGRPVPTGDRARVFRDATGQIRWSYHDHTEAVLATSTPCPGLPEALRSLARTTGRQPTVVGKPGEASLPVGAIGVVVDLGPPPGAAGPHSRACGPFCRGHGTACHASCPTCGGRA